VNGRQRLIHKRDGGYAGEDGEGGRLVGLVGESGVAEEEVSVDDIVRGDGDGWEEREEDRVRFWSGLEPQPFYYWVER